MTIQVQIFTNAELRVLYAQGLSYEQIGVRLVTSTTSVARRVADLGLSRKTETRTIDQDELRRLHAEGLSGAKIAARMGFSDSCILRLGRKMGLTFSRGGGRVLPVVSPASVEKVAPEVRADALKMAVLLGGRTYAGREEIAAEFGIDRVKVLQVWHQVRGAA
jgi:hypothetical protein